MSPRRLQDRKMKAIQEMTTGHESALLLRQCLLSSDTKLLDEMIPQLIERIINSFRNSISVIDDCGDESFHDNSLEISVKAEDSGESSKPVSCRLSLRKGRRGCYKRRKGSQSFTKVVPALTDDGRTWRKYGQKVILNAPFTRSYFRCTHKNLGCLATKQVQQTQAEPPMYTVTYDGLHTCTDALKSASLYADSVPIGLDPADSSSILLSFGSFESNAYNDCGLLESQDYLLSSDQLPTFEGMSSNSSNNCSDNLDHGIDQFMQHEDGNFGMSNLELDELMRLKFDFN